MGLTYFRILAFAFPLVLICSAPANGYEADMHYGLVKWLAFKAGFTLQHSEIIAAASESADESSALSAPSLVWRCTCIFQTDSECSRHVQRHHFPTDGLVPSPRMDRYVTPGSLGQTNEGNRWTRQEIKVPYAGRRPETALNLFGQSLHPLADSFSHQDVPGKIPYLACSENHTWAHSENRGGPLSHDADHTFQYPDDAMEAARTIYAYLTELLKVQSSGVARASAPQPWERLKPDVAHFVHVDTADKKKMWFEGHPEVPLESYTTYPCFLSKLSLPSYNTVCPQRRRTQHEQYEGPGLSISGEGKSREPSRCLRLFLEKWIVQGEDKNLSQEYMDFDAIASGLFGEKRFRLKMDRAVWLDTLLNMWLVPDHGLVNALGHGIPDKKGFKTLAHEVTKKERLKFAHLSEAIHFPGTPLPYMLFPVHEDRSPEQGLAAVFQFRHAPRDLVVLIAQKKDRQMKVVGLLWIII